MTTQNKSGTITEQMRLWSQEFMLQLRAFATRKDLSQDQRVAFAAMEAEQVFPLEEWERAEIRDIADRKKLADLVGGKI